MKRFMPFILFPLVVVLLGWTAFRNKSRGPEFESNQVVYLGESIRVLSPHPDDQDDPDADFKIDPSEIPRVQRLVREAPVAAEYPGRWELIVGTSNLQFPGFGMRQFGEKTQPDGTVLSGFGVEIPATDLIRYVIFRGRDGRYRLIDDFVESEERDISRVAEESGQLVYCAMDGKRVTTRHIVSK